MLNPQGLSDRLLFNTIRIEVERISGKKGHATGLLFVIPSADEHHELIIITNKHVVRGAVKGKFYLYELGFNEKGPFPSGDFFEVELDQFESRWVFHPNNNIDLCAFVLKGEYVNHPEGKPVGIYRLPSDESMFLNDGELRTLRNMEDVYMVGYPNGLWDPVSKYPLIRKGITSFHPSLNFNNESIGVVDIPCFPGSSGSPIYLASDFIREKEDGSLVRYPILLGILFKGPALEAEVYSKNNDEWELEEYMMSKIPINIGYYIKSKEIIVLLNIIKEDLQIS